MVAVCTNNITFRQKSKAKGRDSEEIKWSGMKGDERSWRKNGGGGKKRPKQLKATTVTVKLQYLKRHPSCKSQGIQLQTDDKLENASFLDRLFQCSVQGIQRSHDNSPDVRDMGTLHLKGQRIHRVFCVTLHELLSSNILFQQTKMCPKGCCKLKIPIYGTATQRHISS